MADPSVDGAGERPARWGFVVSAAALFSVLAGGALQGLYLTATSSDLGLYAVIAHVGFLAFPLLLAALALAGTHAALVTMGFMDATLATNARRALEWTWADDPESLARRTATLLAVGVALAGVAGGSVAIGRLYLSAVARPENALLLLVVTQLGLLPAAAVAFVIVRRLGSVALVAASRRAPRAVIAPASVFVVAIAAALLGGLLFARTSFGEQVPWDLPVAVLGAAIGWLAALGSIRTWRVGAVTALVIVAALVAALVGTVWMPGSQGYNRMVFVEDSVVSSLVFKRIAPALDRDEDGSLSILGGRDCAPDDPAIHPGAAEKIDNGIDEDCSGSDLVPDRDYAEFPQSFGKPKQVLGRPHVILVTTDSLSMDRTSLGRDDRDTTPNLAKFARDAVVFEHAFAVGPSTRTALPGVLAGVYNALLPMEPVGGQPYDWSASAPTLSTTLRSAGYHTVRVASDDYFTRRWRGGPSTGFAELDNDALKLAKDKRHTAPEVTDRAIAQLEAAKGRPKPTFLWVHYYDHHHPFEMPDGGTKFGDTKADVFDSELEFADRHWGRLFDALQKSFDPDEYVVVFTADHGEAFDEFHDKKHHGYDLRSPVVSVPLVIKAPAADGRRVGGLASHLDIAPTVADLAGAKRRKGWVGESLVPALYEGKKPKRQVQYALLYVPEKFREGIDPYRRFSVRVDDWYLEIDRVGEREYLWRWRDDWPGTKNLVRDEPDVAQLLRYLANTKLEELRTNERALRGTLYDPEVVGEKAARKNLSGAQAKAKKREMETKQRAAKAKRRKTD